MIQTTRNMSNDPYSNSHRRALDFLNNEKQFHLGVLPTEQSNDKTGNLDSVFGSDPVKGVRTLLSVDRDIFPMAEKVLQGDSYQRMIQNGADTLKKGNRIIFSGCGSTGRLSILLESMWRYFFRDLRHHFPELYEKTRSYEDSIYSIMTGGDYALIRSVESFEDYIEFGRQQVREMKVTGGDMLVAITEGGETSSVLGTLQEAADRNANTFLMFNNPTSILRKHIDRSRKAIDDPRVTVLDLYCGPMAIAGSTRMQATTSELLVAGSALESILTWLLQPLLSKDQLKNLNFADIDYPRAYSNMLDTLSNSTNTQTLAAYIRMEENIYLKNGLITYFAGDLLMDILTDTTERSPTFMLSPYKKYDDTHAPPSWSFVKDPQKPTSEAWEHLLGRAPRCLNWESDLYRQLGVKEYAITPPKIKQQELLKFLIGNEYDESRISRTPNAAVSISRGQEADKDSFEDYRKAFEQSAKKFQQKLHFIIGNSGTSADFRVAYHPVPSPLKLMDHLAAKLTLNTISTGTMVMMGRVTSNWMSWVDVSNKKLRDRGIRLISEICGVGYQKACFALHETLEERKNLSYDEKKKISPVYDTIQRIKAQEQSKR